MTVKITTEYTNVDQKWLDWYLDRLSRAEEMPGSPKMVPLLKKNGVAVFKSKDPSSNVWAATTYEVIR